MRRAVALAALLALFGGAGSAHAKPRVSVTPRLGDVNTTFTYAGSGWRPGARVAGTHGSLCGIGPCTLPLFTHSVRADAAGRFRYRERPAKLPPFDFVGYAVCFGYGLPLPGHCAARARIVVAPPSASVMPARIERDVRGPDSLVFTLAAEHFRAGARLRIELGYPDGRTRRMSARARRRSGFVGEAYVRPGGIARLIRLAKNDPEGEYRVRVSDRRNNSAQTDFELLRPG